MFRVILYTQWKWSRLALLPLVVLAFSLPVLSVHRIGATEAQGIDVFVLLQRLGRFSVWYPALAALTGLVVAIAAWYGDNKGNHAYALSLPIPRWHYVLLRFAAGAVLLAVPLIAMWLGAMTATAGTEIPIGLSAYPHALTVRFALAVLMSYALFFAVASASSRTAGLVLGAIGALAAVQVLLQAAGLRARFVAIVFNQLISSLGPLGIFTGPWTLIDV